MNEDNNSSLSRTSEDISLPSLRLSKTIVTSNTSENIEDGQAASGSNEYEINLQCTSANMYKKSNDFNRDPMFVIVDSSCVSNPSSTEILINKINVPKEVTIKKNLKNNVIPTDIPCTSKNQSDILPIQMCNSESREELQMVDINLQSDNEIRIAGSDIENEPESIVIAYLRNKDILSDNDASFVTRKKSSLLENVPKMETILEDEQFSSFPNQPRNVSSHTIQPVLEDKNDKFVR